MIEGRTHCLRKIKYINKHTSQYKGEQSWQWNALHQVYDGIGMLQTLDGATEEIMSMMQRMRELAVQSTNGTYNMDNRKQMDSEVVQLQHEIQRIADTTKFNGMNIMNPSLFGEGAVDVTFAAT